MDPTARALLDCHVSHLHVSGLAALSQEGMCSVYGGRKEKDPGKSTNLSLFHPAERVSRHMFCGRACRRPIHASLFGFCSLRAYTRKQSRGCLGPGSPLSRESVHFFFILPLLFVTVPFAKTSHVSALHSLLARAFHLLKVVLRSFLNEPASRSRSPNRF